MTTDKKTNNTIQAFWVAIGSLSSFALAIVSASILSRYFDKAEYGTYKQILYVYGSLLVIFSAGLPRIYAYFLPRYTLEEGKSIVDKISKTLFLAGLIFSAFLFSFSGIIADMLKNEELRFGLKLFSPIPTFLLPTLGIEGIFSTYKKTLYIAIYNTFSRLLMLLFIVAPVIILNKGYEYAIYGWLVVSSVSFLVAYYMKSIPFKGVSNRESSLNYKQIFGYSLPIVTASLWGIAIKSADQFFVSRYFGVAVFAEYSNGFIELPFVAMITASTSVVLMPMFSKVFHEESGVEQLLLTWRSALKKAALIIYPLVIFFIVYSSEIMTLLYSSRYHQSGAYFRINMFLNFFNIVIFAPLFLAMGKTKVYSNVHLALAILIWTTDYIVVLVFKSPMAVAVNTTAINVVKILYFLYLSSQYMKVRYFDLFPVKSLLKLVVHSAIAVLVVRLLFLNLKGDFSIMISLSISGVLYGALLLLTSNLFKIDYGSIYKPLIKRFLK